MCTAYIPGDLLNTLQNTWANVTALAVNQVTQTSNGNIVDAGYLRDVVFAAPDALAASHADKSMSSLILASSGNSQAFARVPTYRAPTVGSRVDQSALNAAVYRAGWLNDSLQLLFQPLGCPTEEVYRFYYYQPGGQFIADAHACGTSPTVYPFTLNTTAAGDITIDAWQCQIAVQHTTVGVNLVQSPGANVAVTEEPVYETFPFAARLVDGTGARLWKAYGRAGNPDLLALFVGAQDVKMALETSIEAVTSVLAAKLNYTLQLDAISAQPKYIATVQNASAIYQVSTTTRVWLMSSSPSCAWHRPSCSSLRWSCRVNSSSSAAFCWSIAAGIQTSEV
jgi:hypothetical protein